VTRGSSLASVVSRDSQSGCSTGLWQEAKLSALSCALALAFHSSFVGSKFPKSGCAPIFTSVEKDAFIISFDRRGASNNHTPRGRVHNEPTTMTRLSFALSDENATKELLGGLEMTESWEAIEYDDEGSSAVDHDADEQFDVLSEAAQLFHVAVPSVLIQFSLFFIFPQSASVVGRTLGTIELGGFSLGSLVGNLTCLSIIEGALTAADTLMPRAYGAGNYEEVGRIAVRGAFVCVILLGPSVIPLCTVAGSILEALGQNSEASRLAEEWIRFYFTGVPANLFFRIMMRFLLAQHKPWKVSSTAI